MEYLITREENTDELLHYGVLGMKWGVRRGNQSGTINKAYKKLDKLDRDVTTKSTKAAKAAVKATTGVSKKYNKLQNEATRLQIKADKKKYGFFSNAEKAAELQVKADRAQYKANKYKAKADKRTNIAAQTAAAEKKATAKAQKWARQMNKIIGPMSMNELSTEQIQLGKKYLGL